MHTTAITYYPHMYGAQLKNILTIAGLALLVLIGMQTGPALRFPNTRSALVASPFVYSFNSDGVLNEAGSMNQSTSPYWWVNSGGQLIIQGGFGSTMQGETPFSNYWRMQYALSNPIDTDGGAHPQNLFRLVSRSVWDQVRIEAQFKILKDNWSTSPNRNASNGVLLMIRYVNENTLYYAGIRVDGTAVIKKKYNGMYYTMAQKQEFAGEYVQGGHINILPHQKWLGLRSETVTNPDRSVTVRLYTKKEGDTSWKKLLEVRDDGRYGGTPPITGPGFIGLRTDFMDVSFENVRIENILQ